MEEKKKEKLKLEKSASTFKLIIPKDVEAKIRHLCNRVHDVEWSGTLFYKPEGSFDDGTFKATCVDIFVMDIGTAGYTEYKESPDILSYMCDHPELLEGDIQEGLIHSHNNMSTFYSGTDTNTLIDEGTDRNHFVSLIVNNAGTYTAGVTRKITDEVKAKAHIVYTTTSYYDSFANNRVTINDAVVSENDKEETRVIQHIEWFDMDIEKEEVENNFEEIDQRLKEIKQSKVSTKVYQPTSTAYKYPSYTPPYTPNKVAPVVNLNDRVGDSKVVPTPSKNLLTQEQPTLFTKQEMGGVTEVDDDVTPLCLIESFDPDLINSLVAQLLTGSVIVNTEKLNLEKWVSNMDSIYEKRFGVDANYNRYDYNPEGYSRLEAWIDNMVEFLVYTEDEALLKRLNSGNTPSCDEAGGVSYDYDTSDTAEICAYGIVNVLYELPDSAVKEMMILALEHYIPDNIY